MDRGDLVVGVPKGAFRPSAIFLCLLALFVTAGVMSWQGFGDAGLNVFLFVLAGPLLSIVLPLAIVVLGGIGLPGGAVWVDRHHLRGRGWDSFVSFAGPAMNIL